MRHRPDRSARRAAAVTALAAAVISPARGGSGRLARIVVSAVLILLGGTSLMAALPVLHLSTTVCQEHPQLLATSGAHLELLWSSSACPEVSYLPGLALAVLADLAAAVSASALIAGVLALLAALGVGVWARRAGRAARDWLRARLLPAGWTGLPLPMVRRTACVPTPALATSGLHRLVQRRGPPSASI